MLNIVFAKFVNKLMINSIRIRHPYFCRGKFYPKGMAMPEIFKVEDLLQRRISFLFQPSVGKLGCNLIAGRYIPRELKMRLKL
jgi:hypothetical protein